MKAVIMTYTDAKVKEWKILTKRCQLNTEQYRTASREQLRAVKDVEQEQVSPQEQDKLTLTK